MNRRTITVFAALSVLVAALAAASVAYRVLGAEAAGKKRAQANFERLVAILSPVKTASELANPALRAALAAHYEASPNLLLLSIYERGVGLRWRIPADSPYLPAAENPRPFPEPSYPDRSSLLLSAPIRGDISGKLAVDALYSTLSQGTVFLALRDAILVLGLYLAIAALVLAIAAASKRGDSHLAAAPFPGAAAGADSRPAPAYPPVEEDFAVPDLDGAAGTPSFPEARAAETRPHEAPPSGLYSPASGLGWESYLGERLDAELARSASIEQDLSLLVLSFEGASRGSPPYTLLAKAIMDFFTFRDLAFERGERAFSVILPNTGIDAALHMAEEFLRKASFLLRDYRDPLEFLPLFMGLSSRSGRLVDAERLLHEAATALEKAREDCDSHIIAFHPDADKYRLYLASRGC